MKAQETVQAPLSLVAHSLSRPYPVTLPMLVLVSLIPLYVFIPTLLPNRPSYAPEVQLDRLIPLQPGWALVYGAIYLFLILLPVLVVRQQEHIHRTVWAYLTIWITAYICFVAYPTVGPRPTEVLGGGFGAWSLRMLYATDHPYNCFPSLHVAHSFVSALTCTRVHRPLGLVAVGCAGLVAVSTLFAKQHYVLDVVAGLGLALVAHALFVRSLSRAQISEAERRAAPLLALGAATLVGLGVAGFWVAYRLSG